MADEWDKVTVIRKKATTTHGAHTSADLNAARRSGAVVGTEKRMTAGNKHSTGPGQLAAKLDRESEELTLPNVPTTVGKLIAKQRQVLGLTQKDLATKINEKPQVVQDYESARPGTVPNQQVLARMERVLGVKLRGKDIGTPLKKPEPKK